MNIFKRLSHKIIAAFLVLALTPLIVFALVSIHLAGNALEEQAFRQLEAVQSIKRSQFQNYMQSIESSLRVASKSVEVTAATGEFNALFDAGNKDTDSDEWQSLASDYESNLEYMVTENGWYDLFIINLAGDIVYTDGRESDLGQNLAQGSLSSSTLAQAFRKARTLEDGQVFTTDFSPYSPAGNVPAAFMITPIIEDDEVLGYLALQMPIDKINEIMQSRDGMGETGESYLVGPDLRMRSDSILDPETHTVQASFAGSVEANGIDTQPVRQGLAGETGVMTARDYDGNDVLAAYSPVKIGDVTWVVLSEIHRTEALADVISLRKLALMVVLLGSLLIVVVAIYFARSISLPVAKLAQTAERIADGDLTVRVSVDSSDEIGTLQAAIAAMVDRLNSIVNHIINSTQQQSAAAQELSVITHQTQDNVRQQHLATDQVAAAINEMSATVDEVARNTSAAAEAAHDANREVDSSKAIVDRTVAGIRGLSSELDNSMVLMSDLERGVVDIVGILDVIKGIADQTNLLALNAAIEAARAGEQGRGFAVVADEVRSLAKNTQTSAGEIEEKIGRLRDGAGASVEAMRQGVQKASDIATQADTLNEALALVHAAVERINAMSIQIASAAEQQSSASNEISKNASEISMMSHQTGQGAEQIASASAELARLAEGLMDQVGQFRV